PQGRKQAEPLLPGIEWCDSVLDAAQGAHLSVVLTEWNEFRAVDLAALKQQMVGDVLVDLRNIYRADLARKAGLTYVSIGRPERRLNGEGEFGSSAHADIISIGDEDSAAALL